MAVLFASDNPDCDEVVGIGGDCGGITGEQTFPRAEAAGLPELIPAFRLSLKPVELHLSLKPVKLHLGLKAVFSMLKADRPQET